MKSSLKSLDKLSISILDTTGNNIKFQYVIDGDPSGTLYDIPQSEITGPNRNQYEFTLQMSVSVYEPELNTNVNYR